MLATEQQSPVGLPDFAALLPGQAATMFAPFSGGSYAVLPEQLIIATGANGQPEFLLEIEQTLGDFSSTGQFATLDMRLVGDYPLEPALAAARGYAAGATVVPLTIDNGFARLYATSTLVTPPAGMLVPVSLGLGGEEGARWTMRISADAGEIIKAALVGDQSGNPATGAVTLGARVEYLASGVTPRLPVSVEFQAATLVTALLTQLGASATRIVPQSALMAAIATPGSNLPITIIGTPAAQSAIFAQIMEDRLLSAFSTFTPAAGVNDSPCFLLADPATLDSTTIHWDLSVPTIVSRPWVIQFDPLSSMRTVIQGTSSTGFVKYISVPLAPLGIWNIQVTTNLPQNRRGVVLMGANLQAPANPPYRPASIDKQLLFSEPDDQATAQLNLSIQEQLLFSITSYAIFAEAGSTRQDVGSPRSANANWIQMQQSDFPVRFLYLSADPGVLALSDVSATLAYTLDGKSHNEPFKLTAAESRLAVGIPLSASGLQVSLLATPHDLTPPLAIPSPASDRIHIDFTSFSEYGPQSVTASSALAPTDPPLFIDIASQSQLIANQTPSKLMLTSDAPTTTWTYLAMSPFSGGYCYRVSAPAGGTPAPWSKPFKPSSALVLASDGSQVTSDATVPSAVLLSS